MNSRKLFRAYGLLLFLLLLIFSPARAFAQDDDRQGPPPGQEDSRAPGGDNDLVRKLNLTPDQIEKIRAIREGNREQRRQIAQRIRAARVALDRAIYLENADESVVEQRSRELAEAEAAQIRLQAMTELGVRRILTIEQLKTFRDLRQQAERERRNRRLQERGDDRLQRSEDRLPPPRGRDGGGGLNGPGRLGRGRP